LIGNATKRPAKAPRTVDVPVVDDIQADGSQPEKEAKAKPNKLPIAVNNNVIFMMLV
tara:strand:- start:1489 stop:1659 length:171 start_codon:yes stop_codon:yes gene_type:complete